MSFFPIVFLLAAVAAGEAFGEICQPPRTPTKLIARRTWPGATTTPSQCSSTLSPTTTTSLPILYDCFVENPACGNMCTNLTSTGGVVQSPNYPGDYGNGDGNCGVIITVPEGWMIQLKFTTFNVETDQAYVYVYANSFFLMPYTTGNTIPALVPTGTDTMDVSFEYSASSKPSTAIYNWRATFSVTSDRSSCFVDNPAECGNVCPDATPSGTGVVQSPNFPGDYGNGNKYCRVTIILPAGKKIQLKFTTFNLEVFKGLLKVFDSKTNYLGRGSGVSGSTIPDVVTTTSNSVYMEFISSSSMKPNTTIYNWQASYSAV